MDFYQTLGYLVLGSRLRRLSENFLGDVNAIYRKHDIAFEASWFPVFYLLSQQSAISIRQVSDTLNISHSAASQLTSALERKGLLLIEGDLEDGRKKLIRFTLQGEALLGEVKPVWMALQQAMEELAGLGQATHLLNALTSLEANLANEDLFDRIEKRLNLPNE